MSMSKRCLRVFQAWNFCLRWHYGVDGVYILRHCRNMTTTTIMLTLPMELLSSWLAQAKDNGLSLEDDLACRLKKSAIAARGPGGQQSGFKGVYRYGSSRWRAVVRQGTTLHTVGVFDDPAEAAEARGQWITQHSGDGVDAPSSTPDPDMVKFPVTTDSGMMVAIDALPASEWDNMSDEEVMERSRSNPFTFATTEVMARHHAKAASRPYVKTPIDFTMDRTELAHKMRAKREARGAAIKGAKDFATEAVEKSDKMGVNK